jgi:hypothetical protein
MEDRVLLGRWWHGRFQVHAAPDGVHLRDWLMPHERTVPASRFAGLTGLDRQQAWFEAGLVPGALGTAIDEVTDRPQHRDDPLFWQYPCRTEGAAWDLHASACGPKRVGDELHLYLGLPWATWIDKARKQAWGKSGLQIIETQWRRTRVRLRGLRGALSEVGLGLRVHTVCQHINWADLLPRWEDLGVTDLWLSHCPPEGAMPAPTALTLHPWRLYAVNVEDAGRRLGLDPGRGPSQRPLLASFIGAHAHHYLSDIRLSLRTLAAEPDVVVELTDRWHFERVVYDEQVQGQASVEPPADTSVERYNRLLSDSVFSLCPAGAGANTLRLWESLASGAIPVLFEPWPRLPEGDLLSAGEWDAALVRVTNQELPHLAVRLRQIPINDRQRMQKQGLALFDRCQAQRCF